jgi:hypothetical protein
MCKSISKKNLWNDKASQGQIMKNFEWQTKELELEPLTLSGLEILLIPTPQGEWAEYWSRIGYI